MLSRTPLAGLGLGFAVRYVGTTAGDPQNTIILPGYTLFDGSLRYDWKLVRFQVNATNIGDKIYAADAALTGLMATYCPALLISISSMWLVDKCGKHHVWGKIVGILAGLSLGAIGGVFLEALLAIGVFASHLISGDFLHRWKKLDEPKSRLQRAA